MLGWASRETGDGGGQGNCKAAWHAGSTRPCESLQQFCNNIFIFPIRCFTVCDAVLAAGGMAEEAGQNLLFAADMPAKLAEARTTAKQQVERLPSQLRGSFALVEWLGLYVAGESTERDLLMGLGYNRWLQHHEILEAVNCHLDDLNHRFLQHGRSESEPIPRRVAISWLYGTILQEILRHCFDESASFYCLKGINWSTGHYLQHRNALRHNVLQTS